MNNKVDIISIEKETPLTVELNDGTKTISKEVQTLVEGTKFSAMEVVLSIIGKNESYLKDFDTISNYVDTQIDKILGITDEFLVLEKENKKEAA